MSDESVEGDLALDAGMPVSSVDGETLGKLASVLIDEETEEPGFVTVTGEDGERLVPIEAVMDVEEGTLVLDVEPEDFARLPKARSDRDPTEAEVDLAYRVLGFTADENDDES